MAAISSFIRSLPASHKTGIITGVGDRRDEDLYALGNAAAKIFDSIIIRHDEDLRGRTADNITALLCKGINAAAKGKPVKVVTEELTALETAIRDIPLNGLVVLFTDKIPEVQAWLSGKTRQEKYNSSLLPLRVA
jgi:cyanophycin synthetase